MNPYLFKKPSINKLLLFFSILTLSITLSAGDKKIKVGFYDYGDFYHKGQGIDKDIIDELAKRTPYIFETQVLTRARIWHDIEKGNLDMSVSGIQNEQRDQFAWFIHYIIIKNYAVLRLDKAKDIKNARNFIDNSKLKFGVVRSFKHGEKQDQWLNTLKQLKRIEENPSADIIFQKIGEGNLDAMFSQPPVYSKYIKIFNLQNKVVIQDWTPGEKGVLHGLILSKKRFSQKDAQYFYKVIQDMKKDGTLKRIYSKYLTEKEVKAALNF